MLLTKYLVFERDTGKVVHVHTQPGGMDDIGLDDIMQMLGIDRSRGLDIVEAPKDAPKEAGFRVVDGEVIVGDDEDMAFGGAGISDDLEVPEVDRRFGKIVLPD